MAESFSGRVPPHSNDAETAVLGAILLDKEALTRVETILRPRDFYRQSHQKIFQAMLELSSRSEPVDMLTLVEELRRHDELERVGGAGAVAQLTSVVPSSANIEFYARKVREASTRRQLIRVAGALGEDAYDESREARIIVEDAERRIFEITDEEYTDSYIPIRDLLTPAINRIEQVFKTKESYTGIASGFPELDDMLSGFQNSELIVIGARPSIGKTALALSMAINISILQKIPCGFFTLEMSNQQIAYRVLSMEAEIGAQSLRSGYLRTADVHKLIDVADYIYEAPFYIADTPNMRLLDLRAQARRMKTQHDVKIIFIDYLSLVTSENRNIPRHEQIAEISRSLKGLARELNIPVVALSQVTRDTEGRVPTLANIRESGSIEQDADVVIFLHREREPDRQDPNSPNDEIETQLIVAKQRNGPIGTIKIKFIPKYARFKSY